MNSEVLYIDGYQIEIAKFGTGKNPVLAFHGFGRPISDFQQFTSILEKDEYIISIALFQHGNSKLPLDKTIENGLSISEFETLHIKLFEHLGILNFSLLAYSLGGRISLMLIQLFPERIQKVLLIAPDGLKVNYFYEFVIKTKLGRSIFRKVMKDPKGLFKFVDFLKRIKLLPPKLHRFVYVHMEAEQKRHLVYDIWMIYQFIQPDRPKLRKWIHSHSSTFVMIFGKHDSVIRSKLGKRLMKGTSKESDLHILDEGHRLIKPETINFIIDNSLWKN